MVSRSPKSQLQKNSLQPVSQPDLQPDSQALLRVEPEDLVLDEPQPVSQPSVSFVQRSRLLLQSAIAYWNRFGNPVVNTAQPVTKPVWGYLNDKTTIELFCYAAIALLASFAVSLIVAFAGLFITLFKLVAVFLVIVAIVQLVKSGVRDVQDELERFQS